MSDPFQNRLSEYLDHALSASDEKSVREHLVSCGSCQLSLKELTQIRALLRAQPTLRPPDSFYAGVHARIAALPSRQRWFGTSFKWIATVCTALLVVLVTHEVRKAPPEPEESQRLTVKRIAPPESRAIGVSDNVLSSDKGRSLDLVQGKSKRVLTPSLAEQAPSETEQNRKKAIVARTNLPTPFAGSEKDLATAQGHSDLEKGNAETPRLRVHSARIYHAAPALQSPGENDGLRTQDARLPSAPIAAAAGGSARNSSIISTRVIDNAGDWQEFWQARTLNRQSPSPAPTIDFQKDCIAAVALPQGSPFGAMILTIDTTPSAVVVHYVVRESAGDSYAYRTLPKTDLPITFQQAPN